MPACYSLEWQESQANNADEYSSRVRRYRDQPAAGAFAHFGYRGDQGEGWETPYEKLARMSKGEEWDFHRSQFKRAGQAYPILTGYLNYTILRLQKLDRIAYTSDDSRACSNTGLQTPNEKDVFATFFRNKLASDLCECRGPAGVALLQRPRA